MPNINPRRLKHLRLRNNLSMDDLAGKAGVAKSTIYRMEKASSMRRIHPENLRDLAAALGVKEAELTSDEEPVADRPPREAQEKTQVSFRLENRFRNAFSLVARRYGVKQTTIAQLAPLLFTMVAEDSLRKRFKRLSALRAARTESGALPRTFTDAAERFEQDEEKSILSKDIFGYLMDDPDIQPPHFAKDVDCFGQWNPFELHVKEWFAETGEAGGITEWHEFGFSYDVCREAALVAACGDEDVATALQSGVVGLHEVPADLRGADQADRRLAWLRDRVATVRAEREEQSRAWLDTFRADLENTFAKSESYRSEESGDA